VLSLAGNVVARSRIRDSGRVVRQPEAILGPDLPVDKLPLLTHPILRKLHIARIGARVVVVHNTVRRLELDILNFAQEKRSRRRQAWTEGWEGDRQERLGIL